MYAILLAGAVPKSDDLLYEFTQGKPKALIPLAGHVMGNWVVQALGECRHIHHIIIVGLEQNSLDCPLPTTYIPNQGTLISNVIAGIQAVQNHSPTEQVALLSTADIPLITPQLVSQFIEQCQPFDKLLYYPYVTRSTMEQAFPMSKRTYTKLRHVEGAGGDMFIVATRIIETNKTLWHNLTNVRKQPWKVAQAVGLRILWQLLTRRLTIADIEAKAEELLGEPIQLVLFGNAGIAMDGDKPHQITLLAQFLGEKKVKQG